MPSISVTDSKAQQSTIEYTAGDTLMEVLSEHGFEEILALCGGSCSCATCHLWIVSSPVELPEIQEDEEMVLELADNFDPVRSRLSCQIQLEDEHDGLEVELSLNE